MNVTDGIMRVRYRDSWESPKLMTPGEVVERPAAAAKELVSLVKGVAGDKDAAKQSIILQGVKTLANDPLRIAKDVVGEVKALGSKVVAPAGIETWDEASAVLTPWLVDPDVRIGTYDRDGRRAFIALSDKGAEVMARYFARLVQPGCL